MELELGLALPNQTHHPMMMDLNFGYNNNNNNNNNVLEIGKKIYRGRGVDEEEEEVESKGCLSLLLWSGQPNEEGGDDHWRRRLHVNHGGNDEEDQNEEIVGWPPINSLRKELLHRHQGRPVAYRRQVDHRIIPRNSMYVKVKMEGVPIGRKIDLRIFNSYRALTDTLIDMFAKYNGNNSQHEAYTILYQDREGDWMLAGDVPWETFVESAQRIKIIRKSN